jgi:MoxR-like ATPase
MFKVNVPFLDRAELNEVVGRTILRMPAEVRKVMDSEGLLALLEVTRKVVVAEPIRDYAVRMVLATHADSEFATERVRRYVRWGASPRAAQALIQAARVKALTDGRAHVSFADVRHFSDEVFRHRVLLNYDGLAENVSVPDLLKEVVGHVQEEAA